MRDIDREALLQTIQKILGIVLITAVAALVLVTLHGCAPNVVYVPTPTPCVVPEIPAPPTWPIGNLTGRETYGEIIRAYGATIEIEHGYSLQLETIINGMR